LLNDCCAILTRLLNDF